MAIKINGKTVSGGASGPQGPKGEPGADGKSAYEIAVENGFSGTEAEWLESLKGPPGDADSGGCAAEQVSLAPVAGMSAENVQEAVEELFTSGSEGKALVASAITAKGVDTAADASFQTMRENILALPSGGLPEDVYQITLAADPPKGGTVTGGGYASAGMTANISAVPAEKYSFAGWKEGGEVRSNERRYSFPVEGNRALTASFFIPQYVAGVDWWEAELPSSDYWSNVAYGDGKFVTVTTINDDKAAWSTDGKSWTATTLPSSANWSSVTYGDGKFVVVASGSNKAAWSTDGKSWTATTLPSSANWNSVTYGDGKFVAVVRDKKSRLAAWSTDGKSWTASTLPSFALWDSVTYGDGKFVTVASDVNKAAWSTDGKSWTEETLPSSTNWSSVTYGDGKFVVVASGSNKAAWSTDGKSWAATTLPSSANWNSVTYGDGKFVTVATNGSSKAAWSTVGETWTEETLPSSTNWSSIAYGDGKFVVVASGSSKVAWSANINEASA